MQKIVIYNAKNIELKFELKNFLQKCNNSKE